MRRVKVPAANVQSRAMRHAGAGAAPASTRAPTRRRLKRAFAAVVTLPVTTTLPAISLLRRQTTPWVVARVRLKTGGGIGGGGAGETSMVAVAGVALSTPSEAVNTSESTPLNVLLPV